MLILCHYNQYLERLTPKEKKISILAHSFRGFSLGLGWCATMDGRAKPCTSESGSKERRNKHWASTLSFKGMSPKCKNPPLKVSDTFRQHQVWTNTLTSVLWGKTFQIQETSGAHRSMSAQPVIKPLALAHSGSIGFEVDIQPTI